MNEMLNLLSNPQIKSGVVSIASLLLTMLFKLLSRRDMNFRYTKSDLSIGFNLITSAIAVQFNAMFETLAAAQEEKIVAIYNKFLERLIIIGFCCTCIVALIILIRKYGWEPADEKIPALWMGVIIPTCAGLSILIYSLTKL